MSNTKPKITPAMQQFHNMKEKYPDAVLFFRMGDFYETFYDDAKICAKVLGLTLTCRGKTSNNPIPLAGVPFHAVDGYLKKMIQAGYKVAVCEQIENPKHAVGVVKRDVVRVITPGTLTDEMLLDAKEENYLCSIHLGNKCSSIAWVDISTGHFFAEEVSEAKILEEIIRLTPKECLLAESRGELFSSESKKLSEQIKQLTNAIITERPGWYFDSYTSNKKLLKHFGTNTLEGFGIPQNSAIIPAAGAIIEYLEETQKVSLGHINSLKTINRSNHLQIDPISLRSLEILRTIRSESSKGSFLDSIDETLTGMGARMMRMWVCMPLCHVKPIQDRQYAIQNLIDSDLKTTDLRTKLSNIFDLERIASRISTFRTNPKDLVALASTLRNIVPIRDLLNSFDADLLKTLSSGCDSMDELADLLENALKPEPPAHTRDGGVIKAGFNEQLDHLRSISKDGKSWLTEYQAKQIELTGISGLKLGFNKVFGYYIEVSHAWADKVPQNFVRKQTIKNAERYITDELKQYEEQVLGAQDKALELENNIFEQLRNECAKYVIRIQKLAQCIANIDCISALAWIAKQRHYKKPLITDTKELDITEGKHPVLAETLGNEFVSNDLDLGTKNGDVTVITGPNMSGKSTYIRQSALLVIMAQMGSFIPAKEATIGLVDRIFTRVGASDELTRGQSTFMVEMTETANIINNATEKSLVVLDEVGRGTSTYDGLSLAWAITEYIANTIKCRTLFATHYHELTELAELLTNVRNCNVAVREWMDNVVFLHKIVPGGTDKSYGIHVAKLAGLPKDIIERSKEILDDLENTFAKEASGENLSKNRTVSEDEQKLLFVQKNKTVLDRLAELDINNLTPLEAINMLHEVKKQILN